MKKRVISAFIMSLVLVPIIIKGGLAFEIAMFVVGLYSVKEIIDAVGKKSNIPLFIKIMAFLLFFIFQLLNFKNINKNYHISYGTIGLLFISLMAPLIICNNPEKYSLSTAFSLFTLLSLLCLGFGSIAILRENNFTMFIFVLLIPIFSDTFAYTSGCLIGKHLLCPNISPKKTWEGFITGTLLATISLTTLYMSLFNQSYNIIIIILIILLLSLISALGDLFFSLLKRNLEIKDFSNLIPGHGGVLDRLDSILFVFIAYSIIVGLI